MMRFALLPALCLVSTSAWAQAPAETPSETVVVRDVADEPLLEQPGDEFREAVRETPDLQPEFQWDPGWRRAGGWDYALIGVSLGTLVTAEIIGPLNEDSPWQSTSAVDDFFRDRIGQTEESRRGRIRDASDLLLSIGVSLPFIFDSIMSALWYHESPEVGRELALISMEVQFVTGAVTSMAKMLGSRERPYVRRCGTGELAANDGDCTGSSQYRSFFSGHASQTFAAAATSCVFHARYPLYGGGAGDVLACAGALGVATATGLLRVTGDMHHMTDVITGALVGAGIGTFIPMMRMRLGRRVPVALIPNGLGLGVYGELR